MLRASAAAGFGAGAAASLELFTPMTRTSQTGSYAEHVMRLEQSSLSKAEAMRLAVGGEFEAIGKLEYYLLRSLGLSDGHLVIDVGCGSGRLAVQLASCSGIKYVGTDVVPSLLDTARSLSGRSDWQFHLVEDLIIPCQDNSADFVTFFSVFTHLPHEASFKYLIEAARCLKPRGLVVASFLEFRIPCHWDTFMGSVLSDAPGQLNQFIDRDAVKAWADHCGLAIETFFDGDKPHIPIPEEIHWENGTSMKSLGNLGQSVVVLRKT